MSPEMTTLVMRMVKELSTMNHIYREIIEGCYDAYTQNYHYTVPPESKDEVVDKVLETLKVADELFGR